MAKQRKGYCRCNFCLFQMRGGWWKRILIERDIMKEIKNASSQRKES